ncbi:MAG: hypothetical protein KDC69_11815, partial [Flavobacteriaceae bacterium]|nr:hypothetical protein [Flavobacteriaceae bacterium]
KEPVAIKRPFSFSGSIGGTPLKVFPYTNPVDHTTSEYIVRYNDFYRILPDGTIEELDIQIPEKELKRKLAATFTDANGLNIITMVGDETYPSGTLNWYTYSHSDLTLTKREISLPLPINIDKDNESGWRLKEATDSGLYFYYVSYKNKVKDETRPILTCHVIHVNPDGKAGDMINIDLGLKEYTIIPIDYNADVFTNLITYQPVLYNTGINGGGTAYSIPTDLAYMGIKIDESSKRIYTVVALNNEIKISKDGTAGGRASREVRALSIYAFDFKGEKIYQLPVKYSRPELGPGDNWGGEAYQININLLPEKEGIICRVLNNGVGNIFAINESGEIIHQIKSKPFIYKKRTVKYQHDIFSSQYYSLNDFMHSPYVVKEKSNVYGCFDKLEEDAKQETYYVSLRDFEVLAVWDEKENMIRLNSFSKHVLK